MKKFLKTQLLIIFLFVCNILFAQQADIDIVYNRIYDDYYNGSFNSSNVNTWLNNLSADGKWSDISYTANPAAYAPGTHLSRTNEIILAYVKNIAGNTFYNQAWVLAKIKLALDVNLTYQHATTFVWKDWYTIYISSPGLYVQGLILLKKNISAAELLPYANHLRDVLAITNMSTGTGANLIWEAGVVVQNGAVKNDYAMIKKGLVATSSTIAFMETQGNAGIKRDYSWHEHGPQLYTGGYGFFIIGLYINHIKYSKGTSFEPIFPQTKIDMLSNLLLEGHQWLGYKTNYDFGSTGRDIARVNGTQAIYTVHIDNMAIIDPSRASEYKAWKVNRNGGVSAVIGNKHFWKSDIMVHRGANYYLSVKVPSLRTQGTEQMNSENIKCSFLPLGSTLINTRGPEYNNIYPLWDWSRIPGTTTEMKELILTPVTTDVAFKGTNSFGGGVSSGKIGVMAFKGTYNAIATNKAYFYIGDAMFCMGSGITGNKAAGIVTSVNQTFLNGTITFNNGTNQTFTTGSQNYSNIAWIHHDNVGYIFPDTGSVTIQNIQQSSTTGEWDNINMSDDYVKNIRLISPANIFSVWINHGTAVNNATYLYIVAPDKNLAAFQTFAANPGFVVVQNDGNIQAIHNNNYNVDAIVFYQAGTINMKDGITVQVDKPSLVLVEKNTAGYNVTVSDPNYNAANKAVTITINNQPTTINLPTGDSLGSSSSKQVNLCSTTPPAIITAASAATFCNGGSVVLNANTGTGFTYKWMNGTTVAGTASNIKAINSGSYTVIVTNANGCSATSTATTVTVNPIPTISAGSNIAICTGKSVILSASGGANYKWSNAVLTATNIVSPLATTTYFVTGTNASACSSTSAVVVTVNALPTISAGPTVSICSGKSTTLIASGGNSYTWSNGNSTASNLVSPTISTTYFVTGTNSSACSSTSSILVTVNVLPTIAPYIQVNATAWNTNTKITVNSGSTISFGPQPIVANGWLWIGPNSFNSVLRTPKINNIAPINQGIYIASYTDVNGCMASTNYTISVLSIQTIPLVQGWNLISTNVQPTDSSIATLFTGLDVQEIKTNDSFWRKGQNVAFNNLKTITTGQGYLVYMNAAGVLNLYGTPSTKTLQATSLQKGWNLIGCPYQTARVLSTLFDTTNTFSVKNFDGFWMSGGTMNSITNLEMGKGYFVKIK